MSDHQRLLNTYDAIIIGAGISGLTTALLLAKEGKKVAIFERDEDIAPLIRPYRRKGCEFSPGLHISGWMEKNEVISSFFEYMNIGDGVEIEIKNSGFANVFVGEKYYYIPKGFANVESSFLSYFPECTEAVKNYIRRVKEVNQKSFYFNWALPPDKNKVAEYTDSMNATLQGFLIQHDASKEFIGLLETINYIFIGSKANEVPFSTHAFLLGGFYQSPGFISINGIKMLLSNIRREFSKYNVDLFVNCEVNEILVGDKRQILGIKTSTGSEYLSSLVIASFNPKLLQEKLMSNNLRPVYRTRLDEAENTFGMYVAFYKIQSDSRIEVDNFVYSDKENGITLAGLNNHSGDQKVFCVFLADDLDYTMDAEEQKKRADEKLRWIEKVICEVYPSLKEKLTLLDYLKPWSFERYTRTCNGSSYGIKHTLKSFGFQHKVPVQGLYLVGQAIYPGFLGSMISGFSLVCELMDADKFWTKVIHS